MSFGLEGLNKTPSLDANMVPGEWYELPDEPWVLRFRISDQESVVSLEAFCMLAYRYLCGGVGGWNPIGGSGPMPQCVRDTIKQLVQHL